MLRVSTKIRFDTLVFILEGSLSGLWVQELDRVCRLAVVNDQCAGSKITPLFSCWISQRLDSVA